MRIRSLWLVGGALAGLGGVLALTTPSAAFDHQDSPHTIADVASDITDVYAFVRPEQATDGAFVPSSHVILIMNFAPDAPAGYQVSPALDFVFRVRGIGSTTDLAYADDPDVTITCTFTTSTPQKILCNVNGQNLLTDVDSADAGPSDAPIRIFAGRRSDSAFADVGAFKDTVASHQNKFQATGTNTFAGKNVMSIVIDTDISVLFGDDAGFGAGSPLLAVAGSINRN